MLSIKKPLCVGLLALSLICVVSAAQASDHIFGSRERASTNLKPFPKWTSVLERHPKQLRDMDKACGPADIICLRDKWERVVTRAKMLPMDRRLAMVNEFHNSHPYILDIVNWGVSDYWATPFEFYLKNGDCEDYAIAKYLSLRASGVSADMMRIVILYDTNLKTPHAILNVHYKGKNYILDNQVKDVVLDTDIVHYEPIYSINEKGWWRHITS